MKRSEYKAGRLTSNLGAQRDAESDCRLYENRDDFPGWDPEDPEPFDEAAAPQRPEAAKAEEPEWYEWTDTAGFRNRVSLTGPYRYEAKEDGKWIVASADFVNGWTRSAIDAIRQLVERRCGNGKLHAELASLRARDITQQEEIRRLTAEAERYFEAERLSLVQLEELRTEISRLEGEVQMAEAKAKEALGEIAQWQERARLSAAKSDNLRALHRKSQEQQVRLADDVERLENEVARLLAELQAAKDHAADALIEESLRQEHGPTPFSRDEWRYDFAGRIFANSAWEDGEVSPKAAVEAADALLEALESPSKGETPLEQETVATQSQDALSELPAESWIEVPNGFHDRDHPVPLRRPASSILPESKAHELALRYNGWIDVEPQEG